MKAVSLGVILAITATLAHAEDMAEMISRYRREHGLSAVKTDPHLTAIAERQAKAMAESGIMDHSVAGSFSSRISGAHTGAAAENIAAGPRHGPRRSAPGRNHRATMQICYKPAPTASESPSPATNRPVTRRTGRW
jgi:uncharacterized protein YkwD